MEDIKILEAVERYIAGQMSPDERVYFEQLRKTNSEVDQLVVEHTFFLQQLNRFDEVRKVKSIFEETHIHLAEKGLIQSPKLQGKARVVYLFNKYKRVAAIAAVIAGITVLTVFPLMQSLSPVKPVNKEDLVNLNRKIDGMNNEVKQIKNENKVLNEKIEGVKDQTIAPPVYTSGGTGFLIDTKGFIVTNAHVVENAEHVAIQGANGTEYSARIVFTDVSRDLAILKITDKNFKAPAYIPYSIKNSSSDLAEPIFTLGYPRNDIVYGDGYIAARTGHKGDTLSCQITIPANRGNSGSPILNRNGEVIGILSKKENTAEGVVYAIHSRFINQAIAELEKSDQLKIKPPASSSLRGIERQQQVKKIADYVFMVKVD